MKRVFSIFMILMLGAACKEVYEMPPQAFLQATLLNSSTKLTQASVVTVRGLGLDSLWINEASTDKIMLPLSGKDTSIYLFSFDSIMDTLSFIHETRQKLESIETGFYYEYTLQKIESTHNRIDSILITDSLVTKIWHENIKLYISPLPVDSL